MSFKSQTQELINHYFDWSLWRSGYECDDLKKRGQESLECSRDPCEAVRRLGDEFKSLLDSSTISSIAIVAHDHENKQSSCCSSSSQLIDTLTVVSIKLFELDSERPQCDWGRLVALLAFGSLLSLHCHRLERPDLDVDVVRKWLIHEFFARNRLVQRWIESRQGGWDDLLRYEMRKSRFLLPNGIKRNSFDFDLANRDSMQMFLPIFKMAFCKFSTYFGFTVGSLSLMMVGAIYIKKLNSIFL